MPELNTSSLPDLIFSVLFFFMMVTSMREVTLKVVINQPAGTEIEKLVKKSRVTHIYIGTPTKDYRSQLGPGTRIQLDDDFAEVGAVQDFVIGERKNMAERDQPYMQVSMKIDNDTHMNIVTDVKQELRKAWALNIVYSSKKTNRVE